MSAIAADAGVTSAALYHYADSKAKLYELVFRQTTQELWQVVRSRLAEAAPGPTLTEQLGALVAAIDRSGKDSDRGVLLMSALNDLRVHPELSHLLIELNTDRDEVLRQIAQACPSRSSPAGDEHFVRLLRVLFTGWSVESYTAPAERDALEDTVLLLAQALDEKLGRRMPAVRGHATAGARPSGTRSR